MEVNNDADDDSGDNRINDNNNGRLRAPLKQQPLQMNASQRPNVLSHPSLTSNRTLTTVMAGEVPEVGHTKVATKMNRGGEGILPFNAEGQIQGKLGKLETELEEAISQQDFETCLALKPRINKLKDMLELSQRGLAIDEAKIDAV